MKKVGLLKKKFLSMERLIAIVEDMHSKSSHWNKYLRKEWKDFDADISKNLQDLYNDLKYGTYKHGDYYVFKKLDSGKIRVIHSATPRDRIVDQLLADILEFVFKPKLQRGHVYGSIKGLGQHKCRLRAINKIRRQKDDVFVGSADIRQYYPTCNPDTIIRILCKYIKDKWVISLSKEFLSLGYVVLGNISSNILGHINLLDIDYSIVRNFKCGYLRFCDDTIFISNNKQAVRSAVTYYMQKVTEGGQTVKPNWSIHKVSDKNMVDFLGVRIGTTHRKLRKRNRKEIESRLSELKRSSDFFECERSWAGMNSSFKNINMSNLINYWKDVYPDFLTDYSGQKQPMLVLLRTNGSTGKWRLNFNQQKIAEPTKSLSSEMPDSIPTEQWQCCFVPSDNTRGVEASIGEAPNWYSFVPYLRLGGLSDEEIENIKNEYNEFVLNNPDIFIF